MLIDFTGQVVVVSGGGRGIGRRIAERFADEHAQVVALDLAFPADLRDDITAIVADVTDPDSVRQAIDRTVGLHGRIDVLVNNAGINVTGEVETLDPARWKAAFDVNVLGVFLLSQAVIPAMKAAGRGRIINAASFAAIIPSTGLRPTGRRRPRSCSSRACSRANSDPGTSPSTRTLPA